MDQIVALLIGTTNVVALLLALMLNFVLIEGSTRMKYLQFSNLINRIMIVIASVVFVLVIVALYYYYYENVEKTKKIQKVKQMTQNEPTYEFLQYTLDYIEGKITPDDLKKHFQEYEKKSKYVREVWKFFEENVQKTTLDAINENGNAGKYVRITPILCLSGSNCRKQDTCPFFHHHPRYPRIPSVEEYPHIPHLKEYPNHLYPMNFGKNPKDYSNQYPKNQNPKNFNTSDKSSGKKSKKLEKPSEKPSEKSSEKLEKPSGSNESQVDTSETNIKP